MSYGKTSSGVQTSLDNGDTAKASVNSLMSGSVSAATIKTNQLETTSIKVNGHWCAFFTVDDIKLLGYRPI